MSRDLRPVLIFPRMEVVVMRNCSGWYLSEIISLLFAHSLSFSPLSLSISFDYSYEVA